MQEQLSLIDLVLQASFTVQAVMLMLLLATAAPWLTPLFNDDPAVVSVIVTYLWIVPLSYGLQGVVMLTKTALNVLNKPLPASMLTVIQMFGLYIPLAYAGSYFFGVPGIFVAAALANMLVGILGYLWLRGVLRKDEVEPVGKPKRMWVGKLLNPRSVS